MDMTLRAREHTRRVRVALDMQQAKADQPSCLEGVQQLSQLSSISSSSPVEEGCTAHGARLPAPLHRTTGQLLLLRPTQLQSWW